MYPSHPANRLTTRLTRFTRFTRLLALGFAIAAGSSSMGCALTTSYVEPPAIDTKASPSARGQGREVIVVGPFDDAREDKSRCGLKKNGFGLETADVICEVPAGQWVADALAARLSREGYRVLSKEAVPGPSTIVVRGTVKKLFVEPHFTVTQGDASVDLVVTNASGLRETKTVNVRVRKPAAISTEDPFQAAAEHTTTHLAVDMASAIDEVVASR
jgi:hypothetical protein